MLSSPAFAKPKNVSDNPKKSTEKVQDFHKYYLLLLKISQNIQPKKLSNYYLSQMNNLHTTLAVYYTKQQARNFRYIQGLDFLHQLDTCLSINHLQRFQRHLYLLVQFIALNYLFRNET